MWTEENALDLLMLIAVMSISAKRTYFDPLFLPNYQSPENADRKLKYDTSIDMTRSIRNRQLKKKGCGLPPCMVIIESKLRQP